MSQYDPNLTPPVETLSQPTYVETVVVRPDSNVLWVAGALAGGVLIVALWMFISRGDVDANAQLRLAQAQIDQARAVAAQTAARADIVQAQQAASIARSRAEVIRAQTSTTPAPTAPRTIILREAPTPGAMVTAGQPSSSAIR